MAAGLSEDVFWNSTAKEIAAVLQEVRQQEDNANRRAALIAAQITNANPYRKGPPVRVEDFLVSRGRDQYMSVEEGSKHMKQWMKQMNAGKSK